MLEQILQLEAGPDLDRLVARKVMGKRKPRWSPSANITSAWEVVERLLELDFGVEVYGERGFLWKVAVYDKTGRCWRGSADTVPLAICRAALLAVLGQGKETS
jgi:hypothetical protein